MIRLITDSGANLSPEFLKKEEIRLLSLPYTVDGVPGGEGEAFDGRTFYDGMRLGAQVRTSMVNRAAFEDCFREILQAGDSPLYIPLSSGISGTASNAAGTLAELLREEFPAGDGAVFDSLGASLGQGLLVLEAAKRIREGTALPDLLTSLTVLRGQMSQFFTVDDLRYLRATGRISGATAFFGQALQIKPLLKGNSMGQIVLDGKARGRSKAIEALAERYDNFVFDRSRDIGIAHADCEDTAKELLGKLREKGFSGKCLTVCYEPVTGSHVGPGTVALFFYGGGR